MFNKSKHSHSFLSIFWVCIFLTTGSSSIFAKTFAFKFSKGTTEKILSTTDEDVFINGQKSNHSTITNRISEKTTNVKEDGTGIMEVHFMTAEEASIANTTSVKKWGKEYTSKYSISPQGAYKISDEYFMPVVRNVPIFPKKDLQIGDTWTALGEEAHDLRETLNIETPYKIPFTANYKYAGIVQENGKTLDIITVNYKITYITPTKPKNTDFYPVKNFVYSNEKLYWDNEAGTLTHYNESFSIMFEMSTGDIYEFIGTAHAETTDIEQQGTQENADKIQKQLDDLDVDNSNTVVTDRGIKISLENIQFKAESAELANSEKYKLQKIATVLADMPNDLLIGGHTAKWGSEESQLSLSEERAVSVANYLISIGVKDASEIFAKGYGATEPVAPNDTEENMARNRRVEITILDN